MTQSALMSANSKIVEQIYAGTEEPKSFTLLGLLTCFSSTDCESVAFDSLDESCHTVADKRAEQG
jgi:hypothetical protein